jgi:protein TonB
VRNDRARELTLWMVSGIVVLAAHVGVGAAIASWTDVGEAAGSAAVLVDMAPLGPEAAAQEANLPLAPPQEEHVEPQPEVTPEPDKPQERLVEKPPDAPPPPPPQADAAVTLPPELPKEEKKPPKKKVLVATAPERAERIAPRQSAATVGAVSNSRVSIQSYAASIIRPHILRYYNFPASARAKHQEGTVVVTFTITRQGRLTARNISKSSGYAELDGEALATLQRAQPYPPPPQDLTQQQFVFTLPMRYNIR